MSSQYAEYVTEELLADYGVRARAMFGGYGIYKDDVIFAMITSTDELGFKVDDTNRPDYEQRHAKEFIFKAKNHRATKMGYWSLPAEVAEDPGLLGEFVAKSVAVAKAKKSKQPKGKR